MTQYAKDLVAQRTKRSAPEIAWELLEALNEAFEEGQALSVPEQMAQYLCTVATCDGIAEVLENLPESIPVAAQFARDRGLLVTADALDKVLAGIGADEPVSMTSTINGKEVKLDLPAIPWGATDILLSMGDESLDDAILAYVAENIAFFTVPPPASVLKQAAKKQKVAGHAAAKTAKQLLAELLAHRDPIIRAELQRADGSTATDQTIVVAVKHIAQEPATAARIMELRAQYGTAAASLLDLLAAYDGAALFFTNNEAAFILLPSAEWPGHMADVMGWAQDVTWHDALEEIPTYLRTAIPFGYTPGDSERWLLITEGEHAGKVMLSDTDVIEDEPRFESLVEFMSTLIVDTKRIIGCGGYISYAKNGQYSGGGSGCYYPSKYLFKAI